MSPASTARGSRSRWLGSRARLFWRMARRWRCSRGGGWVEKNKDVKDDKDCKDKSAWCPCCPSRPLFVLVCPCLSVFAFLRCRHLRRLGPENLQQRLVAPVDVVPELQCAGGVGPGGPVDEMHGERARDRDPLLAPLGEG